MVDIQKTVPVQVTDFRVSDNQTQFDAERARMVDALKHGNIYEVFAKSAQFKIADFSDFFANQWKSFKGQVVQDQDIKAAAATYREPDINDFAVHHRGASMSAVDGQQLVSSMKDSLAGGGSGGGGTSGQGKFKADTVSATTTASTGSSTTSSSSSTGTSGTVDQMAQSTLDEWNQFVNDSWDSIFTNQFLADYKSNMDQVKQEAQRMIELVKQGAVNPEYALIALAKVNSMKNGLLMTGMGKEMYHYNEQMNKVSQDLYGTSTSDPNYYGKVTLAEAKTRDGSFQLNLLTQDMQKCMQNVESTLNEVKGAMDMLVKNRSEIIRKFEAR